MKLGPYAQQWPWRHEAQRVELASMSYEILNQEHGDRAEKFIDLLWGEEQRKAQGLLDLIFNPLANQAAQLSSPGIYGESPELGHEDKTAQALIGPGGLLDRAGWQPTMQAAEFYARGLGAVAVYPHYDERFPEAPLSLELVFPFSLHVEVANRRPMDVVDLWERRAHTLRGERVVLWHHWSIKDPEAPVYEVLTDPHDGEDYTAAVENAEGIDLRGERYPWRYSSGRPFIPHTFLRSNLRSFWAAEKNRTLAEATMQAMRLGNLFLYGADAASFGFLLIENGELVGVRGRGAESGKPNDYAPLLPGSIGYVRSKDDGKATVHQIQPATDPEAMLRATEGYVLNALAMVGLGQEKAQRTEGNPTSAAALAILDQDKRAGQRELAPLAKVCDEGLFAKCAAMANMVEGTQIPERDYSVSYQMLPYSAQERAEQREQSAFERDQGLLSRVGLYQREHPGVSREVAIAAIRQAQEDEALLGAPVPIPDGEPTPDPEDPMDKPAAKDIVTPKPIPPEPGQE